MISGKQRSQKTTFRIAAGCLVVLSGFIWFGVCQVPEDPVYNGKKLTTWIHTYTTAGRFSREGNEADNAVRHMGTNCIPLLLLRMRKRDCTLKLRVIAWVQKQSIIQMNFVPAATRNREASLAFVVLGDMGKGAVPALVKMLNENLSSESRSAVADALAWIGPAAKPAVPSLLRGATNSVPQVRASALWALGAIRAEPTLCIPVLLHGLTDSNDWVCLSAVHALGMFEADARSAVPSLKRLATLDPGLQLRSTVRIQVGLEARKALRKIDPGALWPTPESPPAFDADWSNFLQ